MTNAIIGRRDVLRFGSALSFAALGLSTGAVIRPTSAVAATAGKWTDLAPMPVPQCEGTAVVLDGRIYVMGGWQDIAAPYPMVQIYDPATNKWSEGVPLPTPLHHFGAVVLGGKIYVVGGFPNPNRSRAATDKVWMFDPQEKKWIARAPLPEPRGCIAGTVCVIDNLIYAAGGEVPRRPGSVVPVNGVQAYQSVADLTVYDPVANSWKVLPPMRVPRDHALGGVIDGKLYVAGGRERPKLDINVVEEFDPKTGVWKDCAPMPTGRSGGSGAVLGGRLYTFGGEGNPNSPLNLFDNVEAYDPRTNEWTKFDPMAHPRQATQAASLGTKIYLSGGVPHSGGEGVIAVADAFEPG